jgi:hypothetical protein
MSPLNASARVCAGVSNASSIIAAIVLLIEEMEETFMT